MLRIVAMFMIVGSHLACHGVQSQLLENNTYQIWNDGSEINKIFVSFLNPGGVGVALFWYRQVLCANSFTNLAELRLHRGCQAKNLAALFSYIEKNSPSKEKQHVSKYLK